MAYLKLSLCSLLLVYTLIACGQSNGSKTQDPNTKNTKPMQDETLLKPVKALIEAMASENADLIKAQFSPSATQAYGADGVMKSAEATRKWLQSDIIDRKGKVADPVYSVISDSEVVVKGQYSSIGYTNKADFLFTVENGLITGWRMRY